MEYVAVVLLVTVLGAGGAAAAAATVNGAPIGDAVRRQLARALCVVTAGACDGDRRPCPVRLRAKIDTATVRIAVVTLGEDRALVREERSDGTVAVTLARGRLAGGAVGEDGTRLWLGRRAIGSREGPSAAVRREVREGSTWILRSAPAADAFVAKLYGPSAVPADARAVPDLRRPPFGAPSAAPAVTFGQTGVAGALDGGLRTFGIRLAAEDVAGWSEERATGRRTLHLRRRSSATALASLDVAGGPATATDERYAVTVDRDGRPLELAVAVTGPLSHAADLPAIARPAASLLPAAGTGSRRYVAEANLDLGGAADLALADAFLAQLRAPEPDRAAAARVFAALGRRLRERAVVNRPDLRRRHAPLRGARQPAPQSAADHGHAGQDVHRVAAHRGGDPRARRRMDETR